MNRSQMDRRLDRIARQLAELRMGAPPRKTTVAQVRLGGPLAARLDAFVAKARTYGVTTSRSAVLRAALERFLHEAEEDGLVEPSSESYDPHGGDDLIVVSTGPTTVTLPTLTCESMAGCDEPAVESGLCAEHLARARAVWDTPDRGERP